MRKQFMLHSFWILSAGLIFGLGIYTFWYGMGYSYLLNDPEACVNCHIMRDHFDTWNMSSHRNVTCNDCHVPEDFFGKYYSKMSNGFNHYWAFTLKEVQVPRITERNRRSLELNCIRCHESMVTMIVRDKNNPETSCIKCHEGVGHIF